MLSYLIVGLLGSILPIFDKIIIPKYNINNLLFLRALVFIICIILIKLFNLFNLNNNNNINLDYKLLQNKYELLKVLFYFILIFCYIYTIFYTIKKDIETQSISQVISIMMLLQIIFIFLVDKLYYKESFNNYNYLGLIFVILGIILLKLF